MAEDREPRPSSTVVLVREGSAAPELFMVRRHERSSFGAAHAFPGGVLEPSDAEVHDYCSGLTAATADRRLGVRGNGLDYYSAAIRELFEEAGVLLADLDTLNDDLAVVRDALNDEADDWADFVHRNQLQLDCGSLHYFSHWITPPTLPKRYSTRFFIAALPEGQQATHCGGELTDSCWITAHDILAAGRDGRVELHFPTIKTLESIARHKAFDSLMEWARSSVDWGITSMVPKIIVREGRREVVLPGDKDYPGRDL